MISLTNHDSSEGEQWGRDQIYPDKCIDSCGRRPPDITRSTPGETDNKILVLAGD